jgi:hypothetical protein
VKEMIDQYRKMVLFWFLLRQLPFCELHFTPADIFCKYVPLSYWVKIKKYIKMH